ncbi:MAG: D-alanyl-D-alanine carboxypeptidase family protein [Patescibacteria group bacterium]
MLSGNLPNSYLLHHRIGDHRPSRFKLLLAFVILALVVAVLWPRHSASKPSDKDALAAIELPNLPTVLAPLPQLSAKPSKINLQAKAAILIDGATGTILFNQNGEQAVPIASTTKLMTAILTRENLDLDKVVTISQEATSIIGSDMSLRTGEVITVRDLLAGLLITSGNDAAHSLAETVSPTVAEFVAKMNVMAGKLGMKDTRYADPAGLDDTGRSTARDLAIVARQALKDNVLVEIMRTKEISITSTDGLVRHDLVNSNRLVGEYDYPGAIGLKTGFTPEAGHCLVAGAEREGHQLIAVILHTDANTVTASAIEARKLLDWGWVNVSWSQPIN